jgi:hypothetical protein
MREMPAKVELIEDKHNIPKSNLTGERELSWCSMIWIFPIQMISNQSFSKPKWSMG